MASSTVGSSTSTGWKRRSSAASFSMCLRYSSSVVAPIMCSSPRASIGLSMLPASIAPSAAPAPTTVCSSSTNSRIRPSAAFTSVSTALSRSSNSPRYFAPATSAPMSRAKTVLSRSPSGHVAADDPLGQPLDDRGLADAGVADEHRVVLGLAGQDLDHPPDLGVAADDRVELAGRGRRRPGRGRTSPAPRRRPPGVAEVTRWLPRTAVSACRNAVAGQPVLRAAAARPRSLTPSSSSARSRCSTETYSSLSRLASRSAASSSRRQPLGDAHLARVPRRGR